MLNTRGEAKHTGSPPNRDSASALEVIVVVVVVVVVVIVVVVVEVVVVAASAHREECPVLPQSNNGVNPQPGGDCDRLGYCSLCAY